MSSSATSPSPSNVDSLTLQKADHQAMRDLFMRYRRLAGRGGCPEEREQLARRACTLVATLKTIEHECGERIIRQLQETSAVEARYDALVLALADCVERQVRHEESEMTGAVARRAVRPN